MNVFRREHLNYWYSMKIYYLTTTIASIPSQIIFPTIFCVIVYFLTSQPAEADRFFLFLGIYILLGILADSYGLIFACSLAPQSAIYIAPVSSIPFIIFSGYLITIKNIPFYFEWMTYVSYYRYGFEGILNTVYGLERQNLPCNGSTAGLCTFADIKNLKKHFGLDYSLELDVGILSFFICLIRVCTLFVLWVKVHNSK